MSQGLKAQPLRPDASWDWVLAHRDAGPLTLASGSLSPSERSKDGNARITVAERNGSR